MVNMAVVCVGLWRADEVSAAGLSREGSRLLQGMVLLSGRAWHGLEQVRSGPKAWVPLAWSWRVEGAGSRAAKALACKCRGQASRGCALCAWQTEAGLCWPGLGQEQAWCWVQAMAFLALGWCRPWLTWCWACARGPGGPKKKMA